MVAVSTERTKTYMGIAAADKDENSRDIWVYCPELLPFVTGELKAREFETEVSTTDGKSDYSGNIKIANCIKCTYRSTESNRLMPPDIRKGEQVLVTCYSDTNTFYWDTAGVDTATRRTETYRIGVGGTLENNTVLGDDNSYYGEFDTRRHQHIKLSTSKANGETYRYMLLLSPELSKVLITDDINNSIYIDSEQHHVTLTNTDGSLLNLEAENIVMSCKGNITIDAKEGEIMMHSKLNTTVKTDEHFIHDILQTSTVTANEDMKYITHANYSCSADGTHDTTSQGNMSFSTQGNMSASAQGNYNVSAQGTMGLSSQGAGTFSSNATVTISSSSSMSLSAGGGLSMSFKGSGVCASSGGTMTMRMAQLNVVKG